MGIEIERKFLVEGDAWRVGASPSRIVQGFLSRDPERIVRVRLRDGEAFLTIKGKGSGLARVEVEVAIPAEEARQLLPLCLPPLIEKTRHLVPWAGHLWEIDEFYGDNAGLVVAEVELAASRMTMKAADSSFRLYRFQHKRKSRVQSSPSAKRSCCR